MILSEKNKGTWIQYMESLKINKDQKQQNNQRNGSRSSDDGWCTPSQKKKMKTNTQKWNVCQQLQNFFRCTIRVQELSPPFVGFGQANTKN